MLNSKSIEKRNRKPQNNDLIKVSELTCRKRKKVNRINNHSKKKKDIFQDFKKRIYHYTKNNTIYFIHKTKTPNINIINTKKA